MLVIRAKITIVSLKLLYCIGKSNGKLRKVKNSANSLYLGVLSTPVSHVNILLEEKCVVTYLVLFCLSLIIC